MTTQDQRSPLPSVLFLCTANSARSQIAEALTRHLAGDKLEVFSGGSRPGPRVHPMAVQVIEEAGMSVADPTPTGIDDLPRRDFDWVITVCDNANQQCPAWLGESRRIHWSIPDPAAVEEPPEEVKAAFLAAFADLEGRIREWLNGEGLL